MSNGIVLSSSIRSNLLTLQGTSDLQSKVQERLATGKKVNSALDNATNFFTAASFTTRSADLSRLLDSMANGIQTIKAANSGIESIRKLVDNLQAISRQALQAPAAYTTRATLTAGTAVTGATTPDVRRITQGSSTGPTVATITRPTLLTAGANALTAA